MESQGRRRLATRFPEIFLASRIQGGPLGDLGGFTGKSAQREGAIAGFDLPHVPLISFYDRNNLIPRKITPYCP